MQVTPVSMTCSAEMRFLSFSCVPAIGALSLSCHMREMSPFPASHESRCICVIICGLLLQELQPRLPASSND